MNHTIVSILFLLYFPILQSSFPISKSDFFRSEKILDANCREMAEWKMKQPSEGLQMVRLSTAMVKQREIAAGEPAREFSRRCLSEITSNITVTTSSSTTHAVHSPFSRGA